MKKRWIGLSLVFLFLGARAVLAAAAPSATRAPATEVLATEKSRTVALDHSDVAALERIMADDDTYVHASGKVDTKKSYLDAIRSGQLHYFSWQAKDLHVRMLVGCAVINGKYSVRVTDSRVRPAPFNINLLILTVYARRNGRWQQIAWQSTRDVGGSAVE